MLILREFYRTILLILLCAVLASCRRNNTLQETLNRLALGEQAKTRSETAISLSAPAPFNGFALEQILEARAAGLRGHEELLINQYSPARGIFSGIDTSRPWRSLHGVLAGSPSQLCGEGPALESFAILNPLLLASARFWGLSTVNPRFFWDETRSSYEQRKDPGFPLLLKPQSLVFISAERRAVLTYNAGIHLSLLSAWTVNQMAIADLSFSVSTYNARDFGFRFLTVPAQLSSKIKARNGFPSAPLAILDEPRLLHFDDAQMTCNSTSWAVDSLRGLVPSELPAEIHLWFWYDKPASGASAPDLDYVIRII